MNESEQQELEKIKKECLTYFHQSPVDISLILEYLITVIFDYQIPHKPLKILSL